MEGRTISHYRVLEKLGEGGMGAVYLAEDTGLGRKVALKLLSETQQQDPISRKRFIREAESAAALDHPFICKIYEVGKHDGQNFIAMEYLKGQTLKERLSEGRLPVAEGLRIGSRSPRLSKRARDWPSRPNGRRAKTAPSGRDRARRVTSGLGSASWVGYFAGSAHIPKRSQCWKRACPCSTA